MTTTAAKSGEAAEEEAAYARFCALLRLLTVSAATPDASPRRAALYPLLLRSALHPSLLPFLTDPLRQIAGEFISLDGQIEPVLANAVAEFGRYPLDLFSENQQTILSPFLSSSNEKILEAIPPQATIGGIGGALYIPSRGEAVFCRIAVAYSPLEAGDPLVGWPDPLPVYPVSAAVRASACRALRAAACFLSQEGRLPASLTPAPLYFDVCAPAIDATTLSGTEGESLDLPLTLAFISALSGELISQGLGATGALREPLFTSGSRIDSVGWTAEKKTAFCRAVSGNAVFIAPVGSAPPLDGTVSVEDIAAAIQIACPNLPVTVPALVVGDGSGKTEPTFVCTLLPTPTFLMQEVGAERDRLLVETLRRNGGTVFRHSEEGGDGEILRLYVAFTTPETAVRAALTASRALCCFGWPEGVRPNGLVCAFSVHRGQAEYGQDGAYPFWQGDVLEQGARIAEVGGKGRVLTSSAVRAAFVDSPDQHVFHFAALGTHRLRDLRPPLPLFEATAFGVEVAWANAPLSTTLTARLHNLPVQSLGFYGREKEIAALGRLLRDSATPLLTVVGAAGSGKSRLALEAAAANSEHFTAGIFLIPCADVENTEEAAAAMIAALRLPFVPGTKNAAETALIGIKEYSHTGRLLLVLDGIKSNVSSGIGAFLQELRSAVPEAVCLITAHTPLLTLEGRPGGETVFAFPPLTAPPRDLPDDTVLLPPLLRRSAAAALFLARIRTTQPEYSPADSEEWHDLAAISRRFAASPFALTVVASCIGNTLSLADIAQSLVQSERTGTTETLPAHEATALAIETALQLLPVAMRHLLTRLSYFSGGWTEAACKTIAPDPSLVAPALILLEERGLMVRGANTAVTDDLPRRFFLPSALREMMQDQATSGAEKEQIAAAHASYFESLATQVNEVVETRREVPLLDALDAEMDNLRVAFAYLEAADPKRAALFVCSLADFLHYRGHLSEWREWPRSAVRLIEMRRLPLMDTVRSRLHWCCATYCLESHAYEDGEPHLEDALFFAQQAGDEGAFLADAFSLSGSYRFNQGRFSDSEEAYERALALYRGVGDIQGEIATLNGLGRLAAKQEKFDRAREQYQAVARLCRRLDDRRGLAVVVGNLGYVAAMQRDFDEAIKQFSACHTLCRDLRDAPGVARVLLNLSQARIDAGQTEKAASCLALTEAFLRALRQPETSPQWKEMERLQDRAMIHGSAEGFELLRRSLAHHSLSGLMKLNPEDPFAPPLRHLRLETVPLTV